MAKLSAEDLYIKKDRMRYVKNSACSNLCYLGILFNVFYFVTLYRQDVANYYYTIQIGASVVYNLIFMLVVFLSSEGVKHYTKVYSIPLLIAGVMQVVRMLVIPLRAHGADVFVNGQDIVVMGGGTFAKTLIYLGVSSACLILSAVLNVIRCNQLEAHVKALESNNA